MSEIIIASTSLDEPTYGPVAKELTSRGYRPFIYRADRVAAGLDHLDIYFSAQNGLIVTYNQEEHLISSTRSAWFRHPDILGLNMQDKGKQLSIEHEVSALQESLWQQIPDEAWLNHPVKMRLAQAKLAQLMLAKEVGFSVPETVVSNSWDTIDQHLDYEKIIVKMSKGLLYEDNQTKVLYTTPLNKNNRQQLTGSNPFPAIYQQYISKEREWRVTVVGDNIFEAAIYTTEDARDDWRRHQLTPKVTFKKETMPQAETSRCVAFLGRLGLTYGAFDFIEDQEGKITFLECNTNGQFKWLEELLEFPITDSLVTTLIHKHKS